MKKEFWDKRRVLVTGHAGFLGSNMAATLESLGADVLGIDKQANDHIQGDIADLALVEKTINDFKPQTIFHLAAEATVKEANSQPLQTFASNIKGTWNILETARHASFIEEIVAASSDKAYGSHDNLPYLEETPLKGEHPYDVSKSCADLISATYWKSFGLPVGITRCGNIYGPGDRHFSRIVPYAVKCLLEDETVLLRSDGEFTRDYVFVADIVEGYLLLAEQLRGKNLAGQAFNYSNEQPISVKKLVEELFVLFGKEPKYKILNEAVCEIKHQYLCSQKARDVLNWRPRHSLAEGLKKTVEWYRQKLDAKA